MSEEIPSERGGRPGALDLRFLTLGTLGVLRGGRPLPLGQPLQRGFLAALLIDAPRSVPTPVLLERLWGDEPPATAAKSVQKYASNLRKLLGADRVVFRAGYALAVEPEQIDAVPFEAALDRARAVTTLRAGSRSWKTPWRCGAGSPSRICRIRSSWSPCGVAWRSSG